jgi:hypothetical protein
VTTGPGPAACSELAKKVRKIGSFDWVVVIAAVELVPDGEL